MINFIASTRVIVSEHLTESTLDIFKQESVKRAAFIIDTNLSSNSEIKNLLGGLKSEFELLVLNKAAKEPTVDDVDKTREEFSGFNPDILIGIGGGSVIDLTKAISVMLRNPGKTEDYHGTKKELKPGIKKIMVPTTAGTGSEVTPGAVLVNQNSKLKRALSGKYLTPDYAILNAALTLSLPPSVTASCGMDALVHAIESYTAKCSNEITRMYSKEAFRLVYNNLRKVFKDPDNIDIRRNILIGSCLAGFAIFNSNTGAAHAMSYPLGIYNGIGHGLAVSLLFPEVAQININKGCFLYADLVPLMEPVGSGGTPEERSFYFLKLIKDLIPKDALPNRISGFGIKKKDIVFLAERGLDLRSALSNNPVEFVLDDAKRVLNKLI